jgi:hypothetical protein
MDHKSLKQNADLLVMKTFFLKLLFIMASVCRVIAQERDASFSGEPVMGRQLSLSVIVSKDGSIEARVLLRNTSDAPITYRGTGERMDLEWIVSSGGRELPRRVPKDRMEATRMRMNEISSIRHITIEPNASKEFSADLRKLYDFLPDNEYVITAVFRFSAKSVAAFRLLDEKGDVWEVKSGNATIRTSASGQPPPAPTPPPLRNQIKDESLARSSEGLSATNKSGANSNFSIPIAGASPVRETASSTGNRKIWIAITLVLVALVLALLWRAARRDREG